MAVHTFSSRDISRGLGAAKRAATKGPVFITDRGRPTFVLLKIEDYDELAGRQHVSLLDAMDAIAGGSGIEFEPPRSRIRFRAAESEV